MHPTEPLSHPTYRRDIDGLRAIAVLSVVGFHAAPGRFPGGFIGVDIFFVISGYLITTIILQNLGKGSFNFLTFYQRRINRIFPALLVVLLSCILFGSLFLTLEEYASAGQHIAAGAGFYSNFLLWTESGYFDADSTMKPLLHLWSLSIEEQFYIAWPLILCVLARRNASILKTIVAISLLSFALNVFVVSLDITAAFYSPLTRSWELLAGAILACYTLQTNARAVAASTLSRNVLSITGALLLIAGLALINETRLFPGWWAALPVVGTALLIAATERAWINRVILSNRVLVWFGLISYPLYLTHWPLLSFLRISESGEVSQLTRACAVLTAIVVSWLIYTFIEIPVRRGAKYSPKTLLIFCTMVLVWIIGFYVYLQQGAAMRIGAPPRVVTSGDIGHRPFFEYLSEHFSACLPLEIARDMEQWEEFQRCYQSRAGEKHDVAILGDSHAEHLFIGLAEELPTLNVVYYTKGGPPFLSNPELQRILSLVASDDSIRVIVVSAKWKQALAGLDRADQESEVGRLLELLTQAGKKVYIVDDIPEFRFGPEKCKYAGRLGRENNCRQEAATTRSDEQKYYPLLVALSGKYPNVEVIRTMDFFCTEKDCSMSRNGVLLYRDHDHLNVAGSKALWHHIMSTTPLRQDILRAQSQ